jgi:hypothetical protein
MGRRQCRDAEVDGRAVHRDAGAAVLRPAPVGDIEARHDLDAGDERHARAARDLHDLPQHAVDAVAHDDAALDRLDVHVARPARDAVGQHHVDQPDDRRGARLFRGGRDIRRLVLELLDVRILQSAQDLVHRFLGATVQLLGTLADLRRRRQQHAHFASRREREHLLGVDVEGVGRGDFEVGIGHTERQHVEAPHQVFRQVFAHARVEQADLGHRQPEALGDRRQDRFVRCQPTLDQLLPQRHRRRPDLGPDDLDGTLRQKDLNCGNQPLVVERHELLTGR